MDTGTLVVGIISGAIGVGYWVYGKRQQRLVPLLCGAGLIGAPYFIDPLWGQIAVCAVLAAVPFVWRA